MRWTSLVLLVLAACGDDSSNNNVDGGPGADTMVDGPLRVKWERISADGPTSQAGRYVGTLDGTLVVFGGQTGRNVVSRRYVGVRWQHVDGGTSVDETVRAH